MTTFEFLKWMRDEKSVPWSREKRPPEGARPSNSELLRWIRNGSVRIDGETLALDTLVVFPLTQVEFFRGKATVTMPGFGS